MTACTTCGAPLKEFSKFCLRCGSPISERVSQDLIIRSLSHNETRKIFNYLNSRMNVLEKRIDDTLMSVKRIEKILLEQGLLSPEQDIPSVASAPVEKKSVVKPVDVSPPIKVKKPVDISPPIDVKEPIQVKTPVTTSPQIVQETSLPEEPMFSDPVMPVPELFDFDIEYDLPINPVPVPRGDVATTRVEKKKLSRMVVEFVETKGMISMAVIGTLFLMFLISFFTIGDNMQLQSLSLIGLGTIFVGFAPILYSGIFKFRSHNLGSFMLNLGFSILVFSSLGALRFFEYRQLIVLYLYLVFLVSILIGHHYTSNFTGIVLSVAAPVIPAILSQIYPLDIFLAFGGIIWLVPVGILVFLQGIREMTSVPAILLFVVTTSVSTLFSSIILGGFSLALIGSIVPLAVLLDRGKVELLRNYLSVLYAVLFLAPTTVYLILFNQGKVTAYDSFFMFTGLLVTYEISTTELTKGGFRRSIMLKHVLETMKFWERLLVPVIGYVFAWIFFLHIDRYVGYSPISVFLPSIAFVAITFLYLVYIAYSSDDKTTRFSVLLAVISAENALVVVTSKVLVSFNSDFQIYISTRIFLLILVFLPLGIGILAKALPKLSKYPDTVLTISSALAVLNSFILSNILLDGMDSILASVAGMSVFLVAVLVPNLEDRVRRGNYELALVGNSINLISSQILHKYSLFLPEPILKLLKPLGIGDIGPLVIFALYVLFSGVAFLKLSTLSSYRIPVLEGIGTFQRSAAWVFSKIEYALIRHQELSFSFFINLTFSLFALNGGFSRSNGDGLFAIFVLALLIPVNLTTMYLARGRHWGTIIPSIFPFSIVSSFSNPFGNSVIVALYSSIVIVGLLIFEWDKQKGRTNLTVRTLGRDATIWLGFFSILVANSTVDPLVFIAVTVLMVATSFGMSIRARSEAVSGVTLVFGALLLSVIQVKFTYSIIQEVNLLDIIFSSLLIAGVLAHTLVVLLRSEGIEPTKWSFLKDIVIVGTSIFVAFSPGLTSGYIKLLTYTLVNSTYSLSLLKSRSVSERSFIPALLMGVQTLQFLPFDTISSVLSTLSIAIPTVIILYSAYNDQIGTHYNYSLVATALSSSLMMIRLSDLVVFNFSLLVLGIVLTLAKVSREEGRGLGLMIFMASTSLSSLSVSWTGVNPSAVTSMFTIAVFIVWVLAEALSKYEDRYAEVFFGTTLLFTYGFAFSLIEVSFMLGLFLTLAVITVLGVYSFRKSTFATVVSEVSTVLALYIGLYVIELFHPVIFLLFIVHVAAVIKTMETISGPVVVYRSYIFNILLASLFLLGFTGADYTVFYGLSILYGTVILLYEGWTKKQIGIVSFVYLVASVIKIQLSFSSQVITVTGIEFDVALAATQFLFSLGVMVYSRGQSSKYSFAYYLTLLMSLLLSIYSDINLGNVIINLLPLTATSVVLWRNNDVRKQTSAIAFQVATSLFIYMVSPEMALPTTLVFFGNMANLVILSFSSQESSYPSQKILLGINLFIYGGTFTSSLFWSSFSIGGFEKYVWIFLVYVYITMINMDVSSGGLNLRIKLQNESSSALNLTFDKIEGGIGVTQLMFSAIMFFWSYTFGVIYLIPLLVIYGILSLVVAINKIEQVSIESIRFILVGNLFLSISALRFIVNDTTSFIISGVNVIPMILIALVVIPLSAVTSIFVYKSHLSTREMSGLDVGISLFSSVVVILYATSIDFTYATIAYPLIISSILLALAVKEKQLVALSTVIFYVNGYVIGNYGYDFFTIFIPASISISSSALIIILSGVAIYIVSMILELKGAVDEYYSPVMVITIFSVLISISSMNQFVTGAEQSLTFITLAVVASMTYIYGVKLNKRFIRAFGSFLTVGGFIGGIAFLTKVLIEGNLELGSAIIALIAGIGATLMNLGVNSVIKNKERKDIFRIFVPVEEE